MKSCTDSLQVLSGSSCETFPSSSDGTYDVGNVKFEEDKDIKEEEKVNVQEEKWRPTFGHEMVVNQITQHERPRLRTSLQSATPPDYSYQITDGCAV